MLEVFLFDFEELTQAHRLVLLPTQLYDEVAAVFVFELLG
jgi:hypothetical protein